MKKQDLPLSPHLQIYIPQITSLLSISLRISGVALNFVLVMLVLGLLCITLGESYFELLISLVTSFPIKIIIKDAGHAVNIDQPDIFNDEIKRFLLS